MRDNGVDGYEEAEVTIKVFFPRYHGTDFANVCCDECYLHSANNRCHATGEVCGKYPNKYVGPQCPLKFKDDEEVN